MKTRNAFCVVATAVLVLWVCSSLSAQIHAPIAACDRVAWTEMDTQRKARPVASHRFDAGKAIASCTTATNHEPYNFRMW